MVCSDDAIILVKTEMWLFVYTLGILLFVCKRRLFSIMRLFANFIATYRAESVFAMLRKDDFEKAGGGARFGFVLCFYQSQG